MPVYQIDDYQPQIGKDVFIFETAVLIGQVVIADKVSIWSNVTIRADNDRIDIGPNSNIQEGSVLHVDRGVPMKISANVTVGHKAMLHGCTIGEGSLIGMNATVLNHAVIGKNCLIGAGALITEGTQIPDNSLVIGINKIVRQLSEQEIAAMHAGTEHYVEQGRRYRQGLKRL
ncbi:gamma carbonic anhydrase family protein [Brackiella oedipodis]|uniref:gamma carbonic anhydrase family protein n=1 Tax=Brackiella oedipodis TaxID=124225 RepID=UPI00048FA144|nr:gamma carbonic anhydrase family protein [Brackiella oedipodis]